MAVGTIETSVLMDTDLGSMTLASLDYWFYSNTTLTAVTGWANMRGLASLRYAFNACLLQLI